MQQQTSAPPSTLPLESLPAPSTESVDAENPWPGLYQYTERTKAFFHGRTDEVALLVGMVRRRLLTVLYGQSGLGKSSILQAGLFPELRQSGCLPIYIRLSHTSAQSDEGTSLLQQTRRAIREGFESALKHGEIQFAPGRDADATPGPREEEPLWHFLHRRGTEFVNPAGQPIIPVIAFDQFEEIFTIGRSETAHSGREEFLRDLADSAENRPPETVLRALYDRSQKGGPAAPADLDLLDFKRNDYRIILSLREDYLADLFDLSPMMPSLTENQSRLLPLNGWQALDAVSIPGEHLVDPLVARDIVELVAVRQRQDSGEGKEEGGGARQESLDDSTFKVDPALLNMVCRELNHERQNRKELKITPRIVEDLLRNNEHNILRRYYENCFEQLPGKTAAAAQVFVEEELLTSEGYRDMVDLATAKTTLQASGVADAARVIDHLIDGRLLRAIRRREDNVVWLEITHDVLCDVVKESRQARRIRTEKEQQEAEERQRMQRELEQSAQREQEATRREQVALELHRLAEERELHAQEAVRLLHRQRQQARVMLVLAAVCVCFLIIVGISALQYYRAGLNSKRKSEDFRTYAAQQASNDLLFGHVTALPYLSTALTFDPSNKAAIHDLARLLMEERWCLPLSGDLHYVMADAGTGHEDRGLLLAAAMSKDTVYAVSRSGYLVSWQAPEYVQKLMPLLEKSDNVPAAGGDRITHAAFSRDGSFLVFRPRSGQAELQVWARTAGGDYQSAGSTPGFTEQFRSVAFSNDGHRLLVVPERYGGECSILDLQEDRQYHKRAETFISNGGGDLSVDGKSIIAARADGSLFVAPAEKPDALREITDRRHTLIQSSVFTSLFTSDVNHAVSVSRSHGARIWNLADQTSQALPADARDAGPEAMGPDLKHQPFRAVVSPTGNGDVLLSTMNCIILATAGSPRQLPIGTGGKFALAGFSPDGKRAVIVSGSGINSFETVRVWSTEPTEPAADFESLKFSTPAPAWLGRLAVTLSGNEQTAFDIQRPPTLRELAQQVEAPESGGYKKLWDHIFERFPKEK